MRSTLKQFEVLRKHPRFRWLFLVSFLSRVGDRFSMVALTWYTLEAAGPVEVGIALLIGGLASLPSAAPAGALIDRLGVRRMMLIDNLLRAAVVATAAGLLGAGFGGIPIVYITMALLGVLSSFSEVGQAVAIPELVPDEDLDAANMLVSVVWDASDWVGPFSAGLTIALGGVPVALLVDSATFLAMAAIAPMLPGRLTADAGADDEAAALTGRISAVRTWLPVLVVTFGVLFVLGMLEVAWPVLASDDLGGGPQLYGLVVSVVGVSSLVGTVVLNPHIARLGARTGLMLLLAVRAVALLVLAVVVSPAIVLAVIALGGTVDGPMFPALRSTLQRLTSRKERGRIFGITSSITAGAFPVGAAIAGLIVAVSSSNMVFVAAAAITVGLVAVAQRIPTPASRTPEQGGSASSATLDPTSV